MATATKKIPAKKKATAPVKTVKAAKPAAAPAKESKGKPAPTADKPEKADKAKKPKLVRDSYTIPKAEYAVLEQLKQRAAKLGHPAKKSELLRAGLKALAAMDDARFTAGMAVVPMMKTGRPAKT